MFLSLQYHALWSWEGLCNIEAKVDNMAWAIHKVNVRMLLEDYNECSLMCFQCFGRQ